MRTFNPHAAQTARSVQAWQILVGKAMNRQTITYEDLSVLMFGKPAAGVLDKTLGNVAYYCKEHGLPILTLIVVGKRRGTPGHDIPIDATIFDAEREKVYDKKKCDWYNV